MEKDFSIKERNNMDNENKELQNGLSEAELEEKVLEDVSEKIASAAAELEDEIAEAEAVAEEVAEEIADEDAEEIAEETEEEVAAEPELIGYDEEGNPIYAEVEEEVEEVAEPKIVTMPLYKLIMTSVASLLVGALLLLAVQQVPAWMKTGGSSAIPATPLFQGSKTVVKVAGEKISQEDMEYFIYQAATEYMQKNGGVATDPASFDWESEAEDGKTAEEVVKENAVRIATENYILMKQGKKMGVEWNAKDEEKLFDAQMYQLTKQYNEELVVANAQAQGYLDLDQYKRLNLRNSYGTAIADDMKKNPGNYYPDDETLAEYAAEDGATVKHILIAFPEEATAEQATLVEGEEAAPAEGEEAAAPAETKEDKKALAEEVLKKAQDGEDFDELVKTYGEDPGQSEEGYTFTPGAMMPEFEEAAFALGIGEISGIVETSYGYHIIKRLPGEMDLFNYWKSDMKIKINQKNLDAISVADVCARVVEGQATFNDLYTLYQEENPTEGVQTGATAGAGY